MVTVAADGTVSSTGGMVTAALTQAVVDIVASRKNEATRTEQRTAANTAITAAQTAVSGVNNMSTDAQVSAAEKAVADAQAAVDAATALTATERAELMASVTAADSTLTTAKTARTAYLDKKADDAAKAMATKAAKLYAGIYAPAANSNGTEVGDVHAAYNGTGDAIVVTIGDGSNAIPNNLSEDEDTMVTAHQGWTGVRYADPAGGDMIEGVRLLEHRSSDEGQEVR